MARGPNLPVAASVVRFVGSQPHQVHHVLWRCFCCNCRVEVTCPQRLNVYSLVLCRQSFQTLYRNHWHPLGFPRDGFAHRMVSSELSSNDKRRQGVRWLGERGVHLSTQDGVLALWHHGREVPPPEAMEEEKSLCLLAACFPQVTNHMEYHVNFEMRRTTCPRLEANNCSFQEGELFKVLGEWAFTQGELICNGVCLWFGDGVGWNYRGYI